MEDLPNEDNMSEEELDKIRADAIKRIEGAYKNIFLHASLTSDKELQKLLHNAWGGSKKVLSFIKNKSRVAAFSSSKFSGFDEFEHLDKMEHLIDIINSAVHADVVKDAEARIETAKTAMTEETEEIGLLKALLKKAKKFKPIKGDLLLKGDLLWKKNKSKPKLI